MSVDLQNRILRISMLREEEFESSEQVRIYVELIKDIFRVSPLYKRKSRKARNSSIQAPNVKNKNNQFDYKDKMTSKEQTERDSTLN
jgi:hypothetical protein